MSVEIRIGDCRKLLDQMDAESVDCAVTSVPYWGLRDYGVAGQIGLEPTLGEHIEVMVDVFERLKRVMKRSGTVWLNYGDCYATSPNGKKAADYKADKSDDRTFRDKPFSTIGPVYDPHHKSGGPRGDGKRNDIAVNEGRIVAGGYLKPKDLCMVPNRVAIALQDAGWWVRSEIIWNKPNPMPESITDRPAGCHEKIWLLTKSGDVQLWRHDETRAWAWELPEPDYRWKFRPTGVVQSAEPENWKGNKQWYRYNAWAAFDYYYDADAVLQPVTGGAHARVSQDVANQIGSTRANGGAKTNGNMKAVVRSPKITAPGSGIKNNQSFIDAVALVVPERNLRNVWTIPTAAFSEAHFATFPPALVEPCIKAGCPRGGGGPRSVRRRWNGWSRCRPARPGRDHA